jgi:MFS family permease
LADNRLRNLILICLASGAWAFGFGVGSQLVTHWLRAHHETDTVIGLNHGCHYLALALASLAVPWITRQFSMRMAALGLILCGVTLAVFPWADGPFGWFGLRLLNGAASGLSLIPLEALISRDALPEHRARNFGLYGVSITVGAAIGIWLGLDLYRPDNFLAFYLGGAAPTVAGFAIWRWLVATRPHASDAAAPARMSWSRRFLSFGTAWCQGFLEGGMLAFLSSYLMFRGLSKDLAGAMIGVTMIGVILFQVPVSWLADRGGRVPVLLGCYAVTLVGLALVPFCPETVTLACCLFAFGACSGAMYPLGLALLGEGLADSSLARGYAWYMAIECVGSLTGAPAMGAARDLWGDGAMFPVGAAVVGLVVLVWFGLRSRQRSAESAARPTAASTPRFPKNRTSALAA